MRRMPKDTKVTTTNHLNYTEQHPAIKINPTAHKEEAGCYYYMKARQCYNQKP